ncbi:MAG: hypothetical protein AB7F86_18685 [Bdellovibrionales bacterium]
MKALVLFATIMTSWNLAWAAPVSVAKVAELTAHRIDRLVALGRIDAGFLKRLEKVEVTPLTSGPAAFKVIASQSRPADGSQPLQLELAFAADGKALSYQNVAGGTLGVDPAWPDKDAGTLTENALHYVLDNATDVKIKKFFDGLTSFTLIKGDLNGAIVARGQVLSTQTNEKLNVYVKLDGTFISAEIVP